jgi:regulator of sigma D
MSNMRRTMLDCIALILDTELEQLAGTITKQQKDSIIADYKTLASVFLASISLNPVRWAKMVSSEAQVDMFCQRLVDICHGFRALCNRS